MLFSEGRRSDYKSTRLLLEAFPSGPLLPADRGYDADWLREAPRGKGIDPPGRTAESIFPTIKRFTNIAKKSKTCSPISKTGLVSQLAMSRCVRIFFSAIHIVAIVICWIQ
uniref:Transposase DDE domain-containing protein n=1 Tax=Candidatus Kentrum sp. TC TaxID=2126339 RepID=A0A450Z4C0_9GAMM|nr:MAG: hypothetical protein BECKTC1821E_GA0114239_11225 [Candidatus Kentron sp. TC]